MLYYKNLSKQVKNPIFLIGMPRSGTTIISESMSVHEDLGWFSNYFTKAQFFPELNLLNRFISLPKIGLHIRGQKEQGIGLRPFIKKFLPYCSEARAIWAKCCGDRFLKDFMINKSAGENEKDRIKSTIQKVLVLQKKNRFLAKLTGPPRMNYLNSIFPDAFFVHVIRDPRATVSSLLKSKFWKKGGGFEDLWWRNDLSNGSIKEWIDSDNLPVALGAFQWEQVVNVAWHEAQNIGKKRYIEIHYEDFVADPLKTLKNTFDSVGLPDSKNVNRYIQSVRKVRDMNFKFTQNLTSNDIQIIKNITLNTARKAGYIF